MSGRVSAAGGLRGRNGQWGLASRVLERARAGGGEPAVLSIQGGLGSGKSRFLDEVVCHAERLGFRVLTPGRSGALRRIPHQRTLDRLPPGPSAVAYEQVRQVGAELSDVADSPALVALDEPPWSDLEWRAARLLPTAPAVWAVTQLPVLATEFRLLVPSESGGTTVIDLEPLDDAAVRELVVDVLGMPPSVALLRWCEAAEGNPRDVLDLVEGLREEGRLRVEAGEVGMLGDRLPARVHLRTQQLLSGLSPNGRQLLQVAAVLGRRFALLELADLLQVSVASLLPAVEEDLHTGMLACNGDTLSFGTSLLRMAVRESMPRPVWLALTAEVERMEGLREVGEGRPSGLDRSFDPHAPIGGRDRIAAAQATAAPSGGAVTRARGAGPAMTGQVSAVVAEHLAAGRLDMVIGLARQALTQHQPPQERAELQCLLAQALIFTGQAAQATATVSPLVAEPDLPDRLRDDARAARIFALSLYDEPRARAEAEAIVSAGTPVAGDPALVTAAAVLSNLCWEQRDMRRGLELARLAVAHIDTTTSPTWRPHARLALARKLADCRLLDEANAIVREAQDEIDQFRLTPHTAFAMIARARLLARAGRLAESRSQARAGLGVAQEMGAELILPLALAVLATVALRAGDLLTAADYVRRYRDGLAAGSHPIHSVQYDWVELLLTAEQYGPRQAMDLLSRQVAGIDKSLLLIEEPGAAAWLARTAATVNAADLARAAVRSAKELAAANPEHPSVVMGALHVSGLVAGDVSALTRAAAGHGDPWAAAWAAEDLGVHLAAGYSTAEAVTQLETALSRFEGIGAERDAARVRKHLRALGVRRRPTSSAGQFRSGWDSLTDTERTISHLINEGLTNRQIASRVFLSAHTVNYHLRRIYQKLGVRSRVELARLTQVQLANERTRGETAGPTG